METLNLRTAGNEQQITIGKLAQITVYDGYLTIDLRNPSLEIVQSVEGSRLAIRLNERLAYVAPEARGEVAEELGLEPYQYKRATSDD